MLFRSRSAVGEYTRQVNEKIKNSVTEADYPRVARDRKWEGTARITLAIDPPGKLKNAAVSKTSGRDVLDQRAVELVKKVALPKVPELLRDQSFDITVNVRFQLIAQP